MRKLGKDNVITIIINFSTNLCCLYKTRDYRL